MLPSLVRRWDAPSCQLHKEIRGAKTGCTDCSVSEVKRLRACELRTGSLLPFFFFLLISATSASRLAHTHFQPPRHYVTVIRIGSHTLVATLAARPSPRDRRTNPPFHAPLRLEYISRELRRWVTRPCPLQHSSHPMRHNSVRALKKPKPRCSSRCEEQAMH